jgi:thiol-disulfide isomerase/thioredoxin
LASDAGRLRLIVGLAVLFAVIAVVAVIAGFTMRGEEAARPTPQEQEEVTPKEEAMEEAMPMMEERAEERMAELLTLDGRELSLEDFKGKVTVVWFIVPVGCPICTQQADELVKVYEEVAGEDVAFIVVTLLDYEGVEGDVKAFMEREGLPEEWVYALDVGGLGVKLGVVEMGVLVLDREGNVVFRGIPSASYDEILSAIMEAGA